ncbi:16S rRNA (uracil(1498)-N(3))-methyltransferase [Candidatus Kapaibacterium sp.]
MECFFYENLNETQRRITLSELESKHTKALRIKIGEQVLITNGCGLSASGILSAYNKSGNEIEIKNFYQDLNELKQDITLAFGIPDNNDRLDMIVEKCTELGAKELVPLISKTVDVHARNIRSERLNAKSLSAIKQSKRSILPSITEPVFLDDLVKNFDRWDLVILADENGESKFELNNSSKILILTGPEGGFTKYEIDTISNNPNVIKISLSNTRLRAETAAIAALSNIVSRCI